jgi:hypothetical protein
MSPQSLGLILHSQPTSREAVVATTRQAMRYMSIRLQAPPSAECLFPTKAGGSPALIGIPGLLLRQEANERGLAHSYITHHQPR